MKTIITSYKGVFKKHANVITVDNLQELDNLQNPVFRGSGHSYTPIAIGDFVVKFGKGFNSISYDEDSHNVTVGPATTIRELENFLLGKHRRLINRGNFNKQTVIGAIVTGTHGFGKRAAICDAVVSIVQKNGAYIEATLETAPLTSYDSRILFHPLSHIPPYQAEKRSYAVFPYSHKSDPICISVNHKDIGIQKDEKHRTHKQYQEARPPVYLRAIWAADQAFPFLRKKTQRLLNRVYHKIPPQRITTHSHDIDAIYHPFPGFSGVDTWNPLTWAFRPAYTSYNMALFIQPDTCSNFILDAIARAEKIHPDLLHSVIAVRELTDTSNSMFAPNKDGPLNAVDFYCTPRLAPLLIKLQYQLQDAWKTTPHPAKTFKAGINV